MFNFTVPFKPYCDCYRNTYTAIIIVSWFTVNQIPFFTIIGKVFEWDFHLVLKWKSSNCFKNEFQFVRYLHFDANSQPLLLWFDEKWVMLDDFLQELINVSKSFLWFFFCSIIYYLRLSSWHQVTEAMKQQQQ